VTVKRAAAELKRSRKILQKKAVEIGILLVSVRALNAALREADNWVTDYGTIAS
jgi:hypothetical protein